MTTQTIDRAIGEYVGRCVEHLRDLPESDRSSILDDIRQILSEVTAELEGAPDDLLGPPEKFVTELRNAAGFQPHGPSPRRQRPLLLVLREVATRIRAHSATSWLLALVRDLRPGWWVARGFFVAAFLAEVTSQDSWNWTLGVPFPRVFDNTLAGLVATSLSVVGSVQLGRKAIGWRRLAAVALTVVAALTFFTISSQARQLFPAAYASDFEITETTYAVDPFTDATVAEMYPPATFADSSIADVAGGEIVIGSDVTGETYAVTNGENAWRVFETLVNTGGGGPDTVWLEVGGERRYPGSGPAAAALVDSYRSP